MSGDPTIRSIAGMRMPPHTRDTPATGREAARAIRCAA